VPFAAWLYRMAANGVADYWRRQGRESVEPLPDLPDERGHEELERRIGLFQLVDRLPDLQRRVIEMRFVEDKSIHDVAATLERTEGAVKQLQFRAIENLRKGMGLP
jgi:RNA polymerase sigma-70 factor, ECF subfamily